MTNNIDHLAQVIRQVDGDHTLGAGALAEALHDAGCRMLNLPEPITNADDSPRTTSQWETLLDGAAPGPWEVRRHGNELVVSICTTVHDPQHYVGDIYGEWNARLAAAAPAAVAEVVRLRREIDEIKKFVENFPLVPPLVGAGPTEARAYELQEKVSHALTRIREGEA